MKHIVIGCLAGSVLLVLALFAAGWFWLVREAPLLDAGLQAPAEVSLGEPFQMIVTVSNSHERTVNLDSIDIDDAFLEGFQVISIKPKAKSTMNIPLVNQRSWSFETPVRNRGSLQIVYELKPVYEGHFSGDIDVCNPSQDFHTLLGDIVVRPAEDAVPSAEEPAKETAAALQDPN